MTSDMIFNHKSVSYATVACLEALALAKLMDISELEPYHGIRNEGIIQSILILAGVLTVFVIIIMIQSNFVIFK